jgi:hypothetical protein
LADSATDIVLSWEMNACGIFVCQFELQATCGHIKLALPAIAVGDLQL